MFLNTLITDYKFSRHDRENFPKLNTFSGNFIAFLKFTYNLKHFEIKHESHSLNSS